ncbi:uncharacterized protein LOC126744987 [Anthonomus grandis grandis]|uniref:uncharacterized protein LOC126744987 n=1 Tax=Anthonomus grandis grandis TaxID=2921223 RepID=UPI002164F835|nr:uncharacterized protein LOC126744987 [Anthonomus grandis grandis]
MTTAVKQMALTLQVNDVKKSVTSFLFSKKYVKRLVKITVLNIIHNRVDIPEKEFVTRTYDKVRYSIYQRKSQNPFIRMFHTIMHGVVDAIEKDYLKRVIITLYKKGTKEILETYLIILKYNRDEKKQLARKENINVETATAEYLETLHELPGRKHAESAIDLTINLSYISSVPENYEPPYFEASTEPVRADFFGERFLNLGAISTGFHKVSTLAKGRNFSDSRAATPMSTRIMDKNNVPVEEIGTIEEEQTDGEAALKKRRVIGSPGSERNGYVTADEISRDDSFISSVDYTNCVCQMPLGPLYKLIRCSRCSATVHLVCHSYISENDVDSNEFACLLCCPEPDQKGKQFDHLLKWRIVLYSIKMRKCLPDEMALFQRQDNTFLLKHLSEVGIITTPMSSYDVKNSVDFDMERTDAELFRMFKTQSQYMT